MKKIIFLNLILVSALSFINYSFAEDKADKATKDECISKCKEAAKIVQEKGLEEVIKQVNNPKGQFVWKDTYAFLINLENGQVIAHPTNPVLIGKDLANMKDQNGKLFFYDLVETAKTKSEGWVDYVWPKPGEKIPSKKNVFAYKIPGTNTAVFAGVYE